MILKLSGKKLIYILVPTILAFIFFYPRIIIEYIGKESPWASYLYMYGLGTTVFAIGMLLVIKTKACDLSLKRDRLWLKFLIFGMFSYLSLHAFWIYMARSIPYKGL